MGILNFSDQSYSRPGFRVPTARLENMYSEATPAGPGKEARYPRPTLATGYTIGSGPILGMFHGSGVLGGEKYAVSGTQLYKDAALVGSVLSGTSAQFAGSADQLVIIIGGALYVYDGTTLSRVLYFRDYATGTLTFTINPTAGQQITLGSITYTYRVALSSVNDIKIGLTASASLDNLIAAITAGTGSGTLYGAGTVQNPDASATTGAGDTMIATARAYNTVNPAILSTTSVTGSTWTATTLGNLSPLPNLTGVTYAAGRFYFIVESRPPRSPRAAPPAGGRRR